MKIRDHGTEFTNSRRRWFFILGLTLLTWFQDVFAMPSAKALETSATDRIILPGLLLAMLPSALANIGQENSWLELQTSIPNSFSLPQTNTIQANITSNGPTESLLAIGTEQQLSTWLNDVRLNQPDDVEAIYRVRVSGARLSQEFLSNFAIATNRPPQRLIVSDTTMRLPMRTPIDELITMFSVHDPDRQDSHDWQLNVTGCDAHLALRETGEPDTKALHLAAALPEDSEQLDCTVTAIVTDSGGLTVRNSSTVSFFALSSNGAVPPITAEPDRVHGHSDLALILTAIFSFIAGVAGAPLLRLWRSRKTVPDTMSRRRFASTGDPSEVEMSQLSRNTREAEASNGRVTPVLPQ